MATVDNPGLIQRARWAVREELGHRQLRLWFAIKASGWLPQLVAVRLRATMFRVAGVGIGDDTVVCGRFVVAGSSTAARDLVIGENCMINDGCRFETAASITIGDRVYIGHDVTVLTGSHESRHRKSARPRLHRRTGRDR